MKHFRLSPLMGIYCAVMVSACLTGGSAFAKGKGKGPCKKAPVVCIPCTDLEFGPKAKEGFVCIPEREVDGKTIPAAKLFFRKQGCGKKDGETLVFIHGNPLSQLSWRCQQEELSKDFNTIAFDLRGFGFSSKTDPALVDYTLELFADDIHAALEKFGVKKPIWVGHSIGANVGVVFNKRYPNELIKFVAVGMNAFPVVPDEFAEPGCDPECPNFVNPNSPTCWPFGFLTLSQAAALAEQIANEGLEPVLEGLKTVFYPEACQDELVNAQNSFVQTGLLQGEFILGSLIANAGSTDIRPLLPDITIPTFIANGTIDPLSPLGGACFLLSQIPGSTGMFFNQKGHQLEVTDHKRFTCAIRDFLTGADAECCVCPEVKPIPVIVPERGCCEERPCKKRADDFCKGKTIKKEVK